MTGNTARNSSDPDHDVLVVIGAGRLGQALARRLGSGRHVLLADVDRLELKRVTGRLREDGLRVTSQVVDVSVVGDVAKLAIRARNLGPVRGFVHAAGTSPLTTEPERLMAVEVLGVANTLDQFARVVEPGGSGVVVVGSSAHAVIGHLPSQVESALRATPTERLLDLSVLHPLSHSDAWVAYALAKRAAQLRVQMASQVWGERGARVNSVSPGLIASPLRGAAMQGNFGAYIRAMMDVSGLGRAGTVADVVSAIAFLLGPDSSFITGSDLLVDGGANAGEELRTGGDVRMSGNGVTTGP